MSSAFEEIAHLASSENRLRVLQRLAEGPATRRELQDDLAVSQSTASRILADFEDRGWVVRAGRACEITPLGEIVARAFTRLVRTMEAKDDVRDLVEWLPIEGEGLDVTDFADVRVTVPTTSDPFNLVRPVAERFGAAAQVRGIAYGVAPPVLEATRTAVLDSGLTFEFVLDRDIVETIRGDPDMRASFHDLLAADRAAVSVHPDVPYGIAIVDGIAQMAISDDDGRPLALLETENDRIREWIDETINAYVREARRLDPDEFEE